MYKITAVFNRNNNQNYFYKEFENNETILSIQKVFESSASFVSKEIQETDTTCKISITFLDKSSFETIVNENLKLFMERHRLLTEYCFRVNHEYSFYETIE